MDEKLISVIVPIYNVEKYLDRCVESIVNQTYKNLEIILVDDGSPDNCPQICDDWAKKDSRIKVIHKENGGVSSARNAGLDKATGDYIGFVDGDDMIEKDMYEILLRDSVDNDTDISTCTFKYLDENFNEIKKNVMPFKIQTTYFSSSEICTEFFKVCNGDLVSLCNKIIKKSLFEGLRFPNGRVFEDWTLAPILYDKSRKTSYVPEEKYIYIIHSRSISRTYSLKTYCDCVSADFDHYNYFNSKSGITDYNEKIKGFMKADFSKCCHVYKPNKFNKELIKEAYEKCNNVCKSKKILYFYHFKEIIPYLYFIKKKVKK